MSTGRGIAPVSEQRLIFSILNIEQIVFVPANDYQPHGFSEPKVARPFEGFWKGDGADGAHVR
jgi:hypothetical protein